jgi:drug/metabolite transporter (DMT)-like permease
LFGTACGLFAAFVYTGANAFLRAVNDCDPVWVSAMKAVPTTVLMGPVLLIMYVRGQRVFPTLPLVAAMSVGGLVGQLGGNISFQWALGQIGVALTVPLSLGGMILAAAIFGRVFLGEPVTAKAALALALLLASIFVLSFGARGASVSVARQLVPGWQLAAGVAAACLSGVAYAVLNVILRYCVLRGTPLPATLFTVSATGLVALTSLSWLKIGHTGILATAPSDLALMLAAGLCNTVAFVSLTKSLQLTSVVYVNALNATQATMAALAGVLIFGESLSPWLTLGVALTISGLGCLAWAHQAMRSAPPEEDRPWNGETLQSAPQPEIEGK